jgi:tRNA synthetase class I (C)
MSKSLKNFVTVRELLASHTADQFRLYCMLHHYRAPVHYSESQVLYVLGGPAACHTSLTRHLPHIPPRCAVQCLAVYCPDVTLSYCSPPHYTTPTALPVSPLPHHRTLSSVMLVHWSSGWWTCLRVCETQCRYTRGSGAALRLVTLYMPVSQRRRYGCQ